MASIAGLLQHPGTPASAAPSVSTAASSTSTAGEANVSSNDFLALLVTELKNQDPTANADPNQYVNQLVQVNSLEQLININQTLSTKLGSNVAAGVSAGLQGASANAVQHSHVGAVGAPIVSGGNLSLPAPNAAAQKVSQALSGPVSHRF